MNTATPFDQTPAQAKVQVRSLQNTLDDPKKTYYVIGISVLILVVSFMIFFWLNSLLFDSKVAKQEAVVDQQNEIGTNTDEQKKRDVGSIAGGLRSYYTNNNLCPSLLNALSPKYLARIPLDPDTHQQYFYQVALNGKSCQVKATLSTREEYSKSVP